MSYRRRHFAPSTDDISYANIFCSHSYYGGTKMNLDIIITLFFMGSMALLFILLDQDFPE